MYLKGLLQKGRIRMNDVWRGKKENKVFLWSRN